MSEKNLYEKEDPMWQTHMRTLTKMKRNMEISQTIDSALYEYYSEQGLPVPVWRKQKLQWWIDYLKQHGLNERNELL
jgi:hypothetical protein